MRRSGEHCNSARTLASSLGHLTSGDTSKYERLLRTVVPTAPVVKPIKSKYVYKCKYNKDGSIKKVCLLGLAFIFNVRVACIPT